MKRNDKSDSCWFWGSVICCLYSSDIFHLFSFVWSIFSALGSLLFGVHKKKKTKYIRSETRLLRLLGLCGHPCLFFFQGCFQTKDIGYQVVSSSDSSVFWRSTIDEIGTVCGVLLSHRGMGWCGCFLFIPDLKMEGHNNTPGVYEGGLTTISSDSSLCPKIGVISYC